MKLSCEQCGQEIPTHKVSKAGAKRQPRFCSKQCDVGWRKANGFYQRFSATGLQQLRSIKDRRGDYPGNDARRAVLDRVRSMSSRNTRKKGTNQKQELA